MSVYSLLYLILMIQTELEENRYVFELSGK